MKRKILLGVGVLCAVIIIVLGCFFATKKSSSNLTKINVAEVTHSMFYAPMYVALEEGYFEEEGLDVELILTSGADKVSAAVLSGDVQIGFAGPESAIYVYNGGEEDYLVTFSGLTKRDGQFVVSRKKEEQFDMRNLEGKEVLVGRIGGMPMLNFENALKNANINQDAITRNTAIDFASLSGSFISGIGDYVNLFEPNATALEKQGYGYVVASVGMLSGEVPYTAFYTRKSYLNDNKETVEGFTKAIAKGLTFVKEHTPEEIAKAILNQFPDISLTDATTIVKRYQENDSWLETPFISEESFQNLEDIMKDAKLLEEYVPYKDLISNIYEK